MNQKRNLTCLSNFTLFFFLCNNSSIRAIKQSLIQSLTIFFYTHKISFIMITFFLKKKIFFSVTLNSYMHIIYVHSQPLSRPYDFFNRYLINKLPIGHGFSLYVAGYHNLHFPLAIHRKALGSP